MILCTLQSMFNTVVNAPAHMAKSQSRMLRYLFYLKYSEYWNYLLFDHLILLFV